MSHQNHKILTHNPKSGETPTKLVSLAFPSVDRSTMEMTAGDISEIEEVFKKRLTLDKVRAPELQVELGSKSKSMVPSPSHHVNKIYLYSGKGNLVQSI